MKGIGKTYRHKHFASDILKIMETINIDSSEREPDFLIEEANLEDASSIAHVQKESWLAIYPNEEHDITPEDILSKNFESEERIEKRIVRLKAEGNHSKTWVVRQKEQVIGYSSAIRGEEANQITHDQPTFPTGKDMPEVEMIRPLRKDSLTAKPPPRVDFHSERIHFKNEPKLSEFEAQQTFNERRLGLIPKIKELITTTPLFQGKEVSAEFAHTGVSSLVCFLEFEKKRFVLKVPLSLTDGNGESHFLKE